MIFYYLPSGEDVPDSTTSLLFNVIMQILLSAALITYVAKCHPFEEKRDNYIEIFNEMTIFILFVIPFSAIIVDESILDAVGRVNLGYVLIGILVLNLVVNYTIFVLHIIY